MDTSPGIDPFLFAVIFVLLIIATIFLVNFAATWGQITPSQEQIYGTHLQATLNIMGQNFHEWERNLRSSPK